MQVSLKNKKAIVTGASREIGNEIAQKLGRLGAAVAVNCISPGPVDTELFRQDKSEEKIKSLADIAAFGRIGTPLDIANAVVLLVSDEAGWITGQNLCVNGGFVA